MLYERIELTKFRNVEIIQREVDGKMEDCISIPINRNGLYRTEGNRVYFRGFLMERKPNPKNHSHFVTAMVSDKELRNEIEHLGFKRNFDYIGYAMTWNRYRNLTKKKSEISLDEALER